MATNFSMILLSPLSDSIKHGMIPISIFALCSAASTFALILWITYRLIFRQDYQAFHGFNQYVILIYNLLIADFQQALSFLFTLEWLRLGGIESDSNICFAQAWLLNIGDVSSGFFVLAIALHTWYSVVLGRKLNYTTFVFGILCIWIISFILTVLAPAIKGRGAFSQSGAWCWIHPKYDLYRLLLHYVWVFVVEFGTIIVYFHVFLHLRKRLSSIREFVSHPRPNGSWQPNRFPVTQTSRLSTAARYMILYPVIYITLTLPLAGGRMAAMAGNNPPNWYYCLAGSLITSCGWLDTLLYTMTRRVFVRSSDRTRSSHNSRASPVHHTFPNEASQTSHRPHTGNRKCDADLLVTTNGDRENKQTKFPQTLCVDDENWPLNTFATVTIDFTHKDDDVSNGRLCPSGKNSSSENLGTSSKASTEARAPPSSLSPTSTTTEISTIATNPSAQSTTQPLPPPDISAAAPITTMIGTTTTTIEANPPPARKSEDLERSRINTTAGTEIVQPVEARDAPAGARGWSFDAGPRVMCRSLGRMPGNIILSETTIEVVTESRDQVRARELARELSGGGGN